MESDISDLRIDQLLEHDAWLRRMVADLVEPDLVEDIVQETFLAVWLRKKRGKKELRNLPAFLRRVARNLAMRHRRSEARRRKREHRAAKGEPLPSTPDMLDRLGAHRLLTEAVAELDEPYRTTILLRYFEDLTPQEIAKRQGVKASTVRTRLQRGLQQLHGRLERTDSDPRTLAVMFLWPGGSKTASVGGIAATIFSGVVFMSIYAKALVLSSLGLVAIAFGTWQIGWFGGGDADLTPASSSPIADESTPPKKQPVADEVGRRQLAGTPKATDKVSSPRPPALRGRVVDRLGQPIANLPATLFGSATDKASFDFMLRHTTPAQSEELATVQTDRDGRFRLPAARSWLERGLAVSARLPEGYVPIRLFLPEPQDWHKSQALVIAARTMNLVGVVVNKQGKPVKGVQLIPRVEELLNYPDPVNRTSSTSLDRASTNANGEFHLTGVPAVPEAVLMLAVPDGYRAKTVHDLKHGQPMRIVLERAKPSEILLSGCIVDQRQRFVADATLWVGGHNARSDKNGRFELRLRRAPFARDKMLVTKKGYQAAFFPQLLAKLRTPNNKQLSDLVLKLGPAPHNMHGQVVDNDGKPLANVPVMLVGASWVNMKSSAEDLAAGRTGFIDPEFSALSCPAKPDAKTDDDGRFVISGLFDKPYRLRVVEPRTLFNVTTEPLRPGPSKHQVIVSRSRHRKIAGVVRASTGQPLANANVTVSIKVLDTGSGIAWAAGSRTKTDAKGRFVLPNVPKNGVSIAIDGEGIIEFRHSIADYHGGELQLEPLLLCNFRVRSNDKTVDEVKLLDANGKTLQLMRKQGSITMANYTHALRRGRSPILGVSEAARTVVFLAKKQELRRQAIRLTPGEVTELR